MECIRCGRKIGSSCYLASFQYANMETEHKAPKPVKLILCPVCGIQAMNFATGQKSDDKAEPEE